jgi:hypothetical protein
MWAIAGLILTVLTLGGVTLSSYQSLGAADARLIAAEAGNIATASKLWVANSSTDGTFTGINAAALANNIPDLTVNGTGSSSVFYSKIVTKGQDGSTPVSYAVAVDTNTSMVDITISNVPTAEQAVLSAAFVNKACAGTGTNGALVFTTNAATLTCNG